MLAHFVFGEAGRVDVGGDRLAELLVGYAEHGDVTDAVEFEQARLDFGRIDVHSARNDHVRAAVVEVEETVVIEVADVADVEVSVHLHCGPLVRIAVVGEVRQNRRRPQVDASRFAFWQQISVLGVDPDVGVFDRPSDGAGVREPVSAVARHAGTGFGAAVILTDDRPKPVDNASFDFGRAWRSGVRDGLQRGDVVLLPDLVGKMQ